MEGIVVVVVLHLKGSLVVVVLNVLMSASEQQYSGTAVLRRAITHTGQRSPSPFIQSQRRCYGGLACTGLYWPATACNGLYWSVLACTVSSNRRCSEHVSLSLLTYHSMI